MSTVLVTGGTGFVGAHCIARLLVAGHTVRTTVRDLGRVGELADMLAEAGVDPTGRVSLVEAHLERDDGWTEAVAGCDYVLHVASPFPPGAPAHEDELIVPARDGVLRVLRAARDAGVKRVVLTSSFAAVGYGHPPRKSPFEETKWTNLEARDLTPYVKSKTIAEQAAWEFIEREGHGLELTAINPTGIFGPILGPDVASSIALLQNLLNGAITGCPKLYFGVVDVRDVADLHVRAMTHPLAAGERFLAVAGEFMSMRDIARVLKRRFGTVARRVPTLQLPNWLVRIAMRDDPAARQLLPELGKRKSATNAKARRMLGWSPRPNEEAIVAAAESLVRFALLRDGPRAR